MILQREFYATVQPATDALVMDFGGEDSSDMYLKGTEGE